MKMQILFLNKKKKIKILKRYQNVNLLLGDND
jgi:hypothetical protein